MLGKRFHPGTVFFMALVAIMGLIATLLVISYQSERSAVIRKAVTLTGIMSANVEERLLRAESGLQALGRLIGPEDMGENLSEGRRTAIVAYMQAVSGPLPENKLTFWLIDAQGRPCVTVPGAPTNFSVADREWFKSLQDDPSPTIQISDVLISRISHQPAIVISIPIRSATGVFRGAIITQLTVDTIEGFARTVDVGPNGLVAIRHGGTLRLVYRLPERPDLTAKRQDSQLTARLQSERSGVGEQIFPSDGITRAYAFQKVGDFPLVVIIGLAHRDFLAHWAVQSAVFGVTALGVIGLLAFAYREQLRLRTRLEAINGRLADSEDRYRRLFESLPVGVVMQEASGAIVAANEAAATTLCLPVDDLLGTTGESPHWTAMHEDGTPFERNTYPGEISLASGESQRDVLMGLRCRDETRWIRVNSEPLIRKGDPRPYAVIVSFNDVTEKVQARRQAEQANAAKSRFIAAASHDLRQPLQALRLYVDILDGQLTEPNHRKAIEATGKALSAAEGLLNSLLDMSKFDAERIRPNPTIFPLSEILDDLVSECAATAAQKQLTFKAVACSAVVQSDKVLLERMVRNLLHNAIKYTESGRVLLGCRRAGDRVRIEIWDTGIGIAEDMQEKIFDDFFQVGNLDRDHALGLGIGLSVVKRIASALGHRVSLQSKPGRGSVFAITIDGNR